jgi:carbamoyltransferase
MNILSINFNHDGAAVLLRDGEIAGFICTERLSRKKKHPGIRSTDLEDLLDQASLGMRDVDLVLLVNLNNMDSPEVAQIHGSNLKQTWPEFWIDGTFTQVELLGVRVPCKVLPATSHHALHGAAAYFFSPFESAVSLAIDPIGAHAFFMKGTKYLDLPSYRNLVAPNVYNSVSALLFGTGVIGAGKLMGLAPYGADDRDIDYRTLAQLPHGAACERLIQLTREGFAAIPAADGKPLNATLAFQAKAFLEIELSMLFEELYEGCAKLGLEPNLCLSGGTALNSVANQRCFERSRFQQVYLHPACGDDGTAIGAALLKWHVFEKHAKVPRPHRTAMYSRRRYDADRITDALRKFPSLQVEQHEDHATLAAQMIADGKVIGWFQGASEIGPRALGNRSILADPRRAEMKDYINSTIKQRETFRPFAPSILREHSMEWFGIDESPFMLRVAPVRKPTVPAVTHVDGTTRFQTVSADDNSVYHRLISAFFNLTGIPMVLNTSFNGKGEPIVETPEDAVACMLASNLDAVVFPKVVVRPAR